MIVGVLGIKITQTLDYFGCRSMHLYIYFGVRKADPDARNHEELKKEEGE